MAAEEASGRAIRPSSSSMPAPSLKTVTGLVVLYADAVDDLEHARIAAQNRARALRQVKNLPEVASRQEALAGTLKTLENGAILELQRAMRDHPLGEWAKGVTGVGEKQLGRLLGAIGNPADRPNPAKLIAYCGFHVVGGKRPQLRKGVQPNWNPQAKARAYLIAAQCIKYAGKDSKHKTRSPYRDVYDREREKWADRDVSDGHKHHHALSVTAKHILIDIWKVCRKVEGLPYNKNR